MASKHINFLQLFSFDVLEFPMEIPAHIHYKNNFKIARTKDFWENLKLQYILITFRSSTVMYHTPLGENTSDF